MLIPLPLLMMAALPQAPQDFPTARVFAEAINGEFRAHGDFDLDGDEDLLHFTGSVIGWTGVRVFENQGNGVFVPGPELTFNFPASYTIGRLQPFVGDFDGDGNLDFVIARDGSAAAFGEGLEFFLGDGNLGWSSRVLLPLTSPNWIAVGNIDGDAADEVAVKSSDASFNRYLSWVDFQSGVPVQLPPFAEVPGTTPTSFVFTVADVDGDGSDDIAATTQTGSSFTSVQFYPTVAGTPTVGAAFPIPPTMQNISHRLLAGDLDGDGDRDLLLLKMQTNDLGPWVQPFERTAGGWLQRTEQHVTGTGWFQPHDAQLADWNSDGWLDLISGNGVQDVVQSLGTWQFAPGFEAPGSGQAAGGGAFDHDGDGHMDFVGGFTVLQGDGTFTSEGATSLVFGFEFAKDREGDGDVDLMPNGPGYFHRNDGTGTFALTQRFFQPTGPGEVYAAPIAYADFDGDGRLEFLAMRFWQQFPSPMSPTVLLGMERITDGRDDLFEPGVPATLGVDIINPPPITATEPYWATGDIDGDGDVDLLLDDGYRENDGTGLLPTFVPAYTGRGRQVADVDSNGFPDVVTTVYSGYLATATTAVSIHFGGPGGYTVVPVTVIAGFANAHLRDLDGDLDLDLMVASPDRPGMSLFENVGGTLVAGATAFPHALVGDPSLVGVQDFDGDAVLDLLMTSRRPGTNNSNVDVLSRYQGTGSNLGFVLVNEHLAPYQSASGFADVDADGDLDHIDGGLLRSRMAPAGSGAVRQYGTGTGGAAGITPLLGAKGPIVSTSTADELRIVRAWPGANGILVFGIVETSIPNAPLPGLVLHVGDPIALFLPPLGGTPGVAGTGELTITLPDLPFLAGFTIVHQVFTEDPTASSGWASSNGMALTYGQ